MNQELGQNRLLHPLGIYVVHWRQPTWCASAVRSIRTSDIPVDVTVLDNSPELLGSLEDELSGSATVLPMPRNLGYTGAANRALTLWRQGSEPYAVIASHDLHVAPNTFRLLLAAANERPAFGILGPVLTDKLAGANVPGEPHAGTTASVPWVSGTCMFLRRECIDEIGGFDESLGSYIEDLELCVRARHAGWEVGLVPSALAHGLGTGDRRAANRGLANVLTVTLRYEGRRAALRAWLSALRVAGARTLWALRHLLGPSRRSDLEGAVDAWFVTAAGLSRLFRKRSSA
jgi:GT2 family glycosyltransferase